MPRIHLLGEKNEKICRGFSRCLVTDERMWVKQRGIGAKGTNPLDFGYPTIRPASEG